jgi:phenylacetic acid degradation operon negative regulatory protein
MNLRGDRQRVDDAAMSASAGAMASSAEAARPEAPASVAQGEADARFPRAEVDGGTVTAGIPTRMMVLGVADESGIIHADDLARVAAACGVSPEQVRSCVRRLVAEGLYGRVGSGRKARFEPTAKGLALLVSWSSRTRWAWDLDSAEQGWDGTWRLVGFAVPERERSRRDSFRAALVRMGGAAVHGGLYVSPHPWLEPVRAKAERIGVSDQVTLVTATSLTVGPLTDPRDIAASLWPIEELDRRYSSFVETCSPMVTRLRDATRRGRRLSDAERFAGAMSLAVSFTEVFLDDPLLPLELLPQPWPGQAARALAAEGQRLAAQQRVDGGPALFGRYEDVMHLRHA